MSHRFAILGCGALLIAGCASQTIAPTYTTTNPHIQVGGQRPVDDGPVIENAGSFCLEVSEKWHQDGKAPDGKPLWARDTFRKVVPCP